MAPGSSVSNADKVPWLWIFLGVVGTIFVCAILVALIAWAPPRRQSKRDFLELERRNEKARKRRLEGKDAGPGKKLRL